MKAAKAAAAPNAQLPHGLDIDIELQQTCVYHIRGLDIDIELQQTCVYHIRGLDIDIELQQLRLAAGLIYLQYKHISVVV
jgi:hypothetical protein